MRKTSCETLKKSWNMLKIWQIRSKALFIKLILRRFPKKPLSGTRFFTNYLDIFYIIYNYLEKLMFNSRNSFFFTFIVLITVCTCTAFAQWVILKQKICKIIKNMFGPKWSSVLCTLCWHYHEETYCDKVFKKSTFLYKI